MFTREMTNINTELKNIGKKLKSKIINVVRNENVKKR